MTKKRTSLVLATNYHKGLPQKIRQYLNSRGIPNMVIDFHLLGWNGWRITIPIFDRDGELALFKLAQSPEDEDPSPKMISSMGGHAELYGWENILSKAKQIIICEGEFDRLVLEANRFRAVTSTGGAGSFRPEWAKEFETIPEVYICYDRDETGRSGALRVGRMIPHARIVELPEEVGERGDVTDYFVHLGHSREDFEKLLEKAKPAPPAPEPVNTPYTSKARDSDPLLGQRLDRIKRDLPIAGVIGQYVKLHDTGTNLIGLCPFHEDRIPSFVVYPQTATFHCFGCQKHGDVITFLREKENLGFNQALDVLDYFSSQQHDSGAQ